MLSQKNSWETACNVTTGGRLPFCHVVVSALLNLSALAHPLHCDCIRTLRLRTQGIMSSGATPHEQPRYFYRYVLNQYQPQPCSQQVNKWTSFEVLLP